MTITFGPRWQSPETDGAVWVETPVGEPCLYCKVPIEDGDQGVILTYMADAGDGWQERPAHGGCNAGNIVGHTFGVCPCTGWEPGTKATGDEVWRRLGHAPRLRGEEPLPG